MKLFLVSFLLYIPICYMSLCYKPFQCKAFLHSITTPSFDSKRQLIHRYSISYCKASFIEYINSNDKREVERYVHDHPTKKFYHTVFGDMTNNSMIFIWCTTIFLIFNLAFYQTIFVLDIFQQIKEKRN